MSLQSITDYLLEHRWRALAITFFCTFLPVVGALSILFAALVTLRKGIVEGAVFALAATVPYVISAGISEGTPQQSLLVWGALGVILVSNIMTWIIAALVRREISFSAILQWSALLGMLIVSVLHLVYPDIDSWWAQQLTIYFSQSTELLNKLQSQATVPTSSQVEVINVFKYYATGFAIAAVLLNAFIQVIIAIWWQAAVYKVGHLRKELLNIRLSKLMGVFLVVGFLLSYLGNRVGLDIMPILYMIFCIVGLSLMHYVVAYNKASGWWLIMMYLMLIWLFPYSVLFVALMALLDIWLNFRRFAHR